MERLGAHVDHHEVHVDGIHGEAAHGQAAYGEDAGDRPEYGAAVLLVKLVEPEGAVLQEPSQDDQRQRAGELQQ